jgi:hypothetical protein
MKPWLGLALSMAAAAPCAAEPLGALADVSIVDRDTGVRLAPYYHRGEYWIAGRPGARYAIEIRNRLGERLLAVTSVDGVNVLSGASAAWGQEGYVFDAYEDYQITGWRKSDAEVAAFTFTASPDSYAERTGRPANVGVIGVAFFRERGPRYSSLDSLSTGTSDSPAETQEAPARFGVAQAGQPQAAPPSAAAAAPAQRLAAPAEESNRLAEAQRAPVTNALREPKLGTGHGEREYSHVNHTVFARLQPEPNEVIRIRYDSLDNLIAMGIVKRGRPVPPTLNPFPGSPQESYVPDPPG